ncbi:MAG: insulinase family protein [Firmicutes bacterium]|nr:insulinase family protein [Bacillota bacterium]
MKKTNIKHLDLTLYTEKLDNGLEVYIIPKNNYNNIYVTFTTKFGSNEIEFVPIDNNKMIKVPLGIAHFLEHKLFEQKDGTDPFSFYNERGADANANTNQYKTTYLFSGPNFYEENLEYLLDYVQEPYFTDENVEKEKGIIAQEIKMYEDDPDTVIYEKTIENCFKKHPMKNSIIGTINSINKIKKEDLYTCYNTFYHPANMFITITGNVDPYATLELIKNNQNKKKFKEFKPIKIKKYDEPMEVAKKFDSERLNISIEECVLAYKIPLTKNYQNLIYTLTYFDTRLGSTSKFSEDLIDNEIINVPLMLDYNIIDDYLILFVFGISKTPNELIKQIKDEMNTIKIDENEFNRKKKTLISSLLYLSDNIFRLNHNVINDIIYYGKYNPNIYDDIKKLNFDDYKNLINNLNLNNTSTFIAEKK